MERSKLTFVVEIINNTNRGTGKPQIEISRGLDGDYQQLRARGVGTWRISNSFLAQVETARLGNMVDEWLNKKSTKEGKYEPKSPIDAWVEQWEKNK